MIVGGIPLLFTTATPAVDPYWASVQLLMHGNGANGGTTFIDSSNIARTITPTGNAQTSTAQSKFNGSSMKFDGTGDYATAAQDNGFDLGTGDFTLECFVFIAGNSSLGADNNRRAVLFGCVNPTGGAVNGYALVINADAITTGAGGLFLDVWNSDVEHYTLASPNISQGTWHHIAATRGGSSVKLWVNGVDKTSSGTLTSQGVNDAGNHGMRVGGLYYSVPHDLNGYMAEVRITKGVCRYTATFTPPASPFPNT